MSDRTKCQYCYKNFTKYSNRKRHEINCLFRTEPCVAYTCLHCSKSYLTEKGLDSHLLKCSKTTDKGPKQKRQIKQCFLSGCTEAFLHRYKLIEHIKVCHPEITIKDPVYLKFKSQQEFQDWKEKEEEATFSYYYQKRGHLKCRKQYFDCQHDSSDKPHAPRKTSRRRAIPSVKTGQCCISQMKVWKDEDGLIALEYWPTHSHRLSPEDFRTHPASRKTLKYIDEQISLGVSPSEIYLNLQKSVQTETDDVRSFKHSVINLDRIRKRAKRIKNSKVIWMMEILPSEQLPQIVPLGTAENNVS